MLDEDGVVEGVLDEDGELVGVFIKQAAYAQLLQRPSCLTPSTQQWQHSAPGA